MIHSARPQYRQWRSLLSFENCFAQFWKMRLYVQMEVRKDEMYENSDHYLPRLSVGQVDQLRQSLFLKFLSNLISNSPMACISSWMTMPVYMQP